MYQNKMAVSVKVAGKVLREHGETVALPFGAEYELSFKNLNSVRALVTISIDGQDATEGVQLVVPANGVLALERFIKNGNFKSGNRFKFIERAAKIENHRGIGAEDGLIRIEYQYEKTAAQFVWPLTNQIVYTPPPPYCISQPTRFQGPYFTQPYITCGMAQTQSSQQPGSQTINISAGVAGETILTAAPTNTTTTAHTAAAGITVPGSVSEQTFSSVFAIPTDGVKHVMVIRLLGEIHGAEVLQPVFVKSKLTCAVCGTVNKGNAKFCGECGAALTIL